MKYNKIISAASAFAVMLSLTGCGENAWNDHLDGFDVPGITDQQTISYTLTDADYATLSGLAANKALAGETLADQLKAVGTQRYFTSDIPAAQYVPAFLNSSNFPYFTLTDGSAVKLTYRVAEAMPEQVAAVGAAQQYTVSDEDYQQVWGSADDYTPAFAPKHTADASIPKILRDEFPDAEAGDYVIVNYQNSIVNPVFGGGSVLPPTPAFTPSNVVASLAEGQNVAINGIVTGVCNAGFILTDNSGSVFVYMGSTYDTAQYPIGTQLVVDAQIGAYNKGLQVTGASSSFEVAGTEKSVTYPTPKVFTAADFETAAARTTPAIAEYGQVTGKIVISGNNINIDLGSENVMGGIYYASDELKAQLQEGETMTVTGYFIAVAASRYCNFVVTKVEAGAKAAPKRVRKRVVEVPSTSMVAVYVCDGANWSKPASMVVLQPSDYTDMGQTYGNLSAPNEYLPTYLKHKYPYAKDEDSMFVVYKYYSGGVTSYRCDKYTYKNGEWTLFNGSVETTSQFVKLKGVWVFDPNVTITLPAGKGQELSTLYFQACVDYVYETYDIPLGSTSIKSGIGYVTSYGNNEYYSGASAYQGNVDVRGASARGQYPAGYEGMSDEEISLKMQERFLHEVFPKALGRVHPDAKPLEGMDVIYTINFSVYNGKTTAYTVKYKLIGVGEFEFVETDWQ